MFRLQQIPSHAIKQNQKSLQIITKIVTTNSGSKAVRDNHQSPLKSSVWGVCWTSVSTAISGTGPPPCNKLWGRRGGGRGRGWECWREMARESERGRGRMRRRKRRSRGGEEEKEVGKGSGCGVRRGRSRRDVEEKGGEREKSVKWRGRRKGERE